MLLLLLSCRLVGMVSDGDLAQDLTRLCRIAERAQREVPADARQQLAIIVREAAREEIGPAGLALLTAVQQAPPAARKRVLKEVLERNGLEDVRCPVLRDALVGGR
jgi:hypothetical protein